MFRRLILLYGLLVLATTAGLGFALFPDAPPLRVIVFVAAATVAAVVPALVVERRYAHPLTEVTAAAHPITGGHFGDKNYALGGGENGKVTPAFKAMRERVAEPIFQGEGEPREIGN